jgi:hypothetical protein
LRQVGAPVTLSDGASRRHARPALWPKFILIQGLRQALWDVPAKVGEGIEKTADFLLLFQIFELKRGSHRSSVIFIFTHAFGINGSEGEGFTTAKTIPLGEVGTGDAHPRIRSNRSLCIGTRSYSVVLMFSRPGWSSPVSSSGFGGTTLYQRPVSLNR